MFFSVVRNLARNKLAAIEAPDLYFLAVNFTVRHRRTEIFSRRGALRGYIKTAIPARQCLVFPKTPAAIKNRCFSLIIIMNGSRFTALWAHDGHIRPKRKCA
jgi:hypothetical protein